MISHGIVTQANAMTEKPKIDIFVSGCPSRDLIEIIGNKWTLLIIAALAAGPMRTGDLQRRVGEISSKMLAQTVKTLEAHGLVERRDYHEVPPRVDYRLTPLGESLRAVVGELDRWVVQNFWNVSEACTKTKHAVETQKTS